MKLIRTNNYIDNSKLICYLNVYKKGMPVTQTRVQIVDDIVKAQKQIMRDMHAGTELSWIQLELTMAQLKGLFVLSDNAMTIGQVAEALHTGKPAASILVDRLVQLGFVERLEDPLDRRRTIARLTPVGDELAARLQQGGRQRLNEALDRLSEMDLAALAQGLRSLAAAIADVGTPAHV